MNTTHPMPRSRSPHRRARPVLTVTAGIALTAVALAGCATGVATSTSTPATSTSQTASSTTETTTSAATTAETISSTTAAATTFLATLSDAQRDTVVYAYDDESKTTSWSNFPVTFVQRAGLNLTDLTEEQQAAALAVLESLLNDEAYATVTAIMGGDQFLTENATSAQDSLGQYYIAFFGDPSDSTAWHIQFGGHHLGVNATMDGSTGEITFAPTHLGVQPAVYSDENGTEVQPFGTIYDTAFAFYDSLTAEQKAALYQGEDLPTMACEPGNTCDFPTGTGLLGADLTDEQKQLLLAVIVNWAGMADEETTAAALAEIEATLDETYVNWSGATVYDMSTGEGIYFQISGPNVYVEFAPQDGSAGADVAGVVTAGWGHVHTIYRDPTNDYANSVIQQAATGGALR